MSDFRKARAEHIRLKKERVIVKQHYYKNEKVTLLGIFQRSHVIGPSVLLGGHNGGQVMFPVAVIEFQNGRILEVILSEVQFE